MLVQDVALQHMPVVFALDRAGLVGDDGPTHHGAFDLSFLRMIPGLVVMAPSSHAQLQHMVHTALSHAGPVALRYPRGLAAPFDEPRRLKKIPIGTAEVLREGREVALIGIGTGVGLALRAADLLAERRRAADGGRRALRQAARHRACSTSSPTPTPAS